MTTLGIRRACRYVKREKKHYKSITFICKGLNVCCLSFCPFQTNIVSAYGLFKLSHFFLFVVARWEGREGIQTNTFLSEFI